MYMYTGFEKKLQINGKECQRKTERNFMDLKKVCEIQMKGS